MPTFIIKNNPGLTQPVILAKEDQKHILKSLRLKVGEAIEVTDSQGTKGQAYLTSTTPLAFELKDVTSYPKPPELSVALPLIEKDRLEWAVQKLCELNVNAIYFFHSERCQYRDISHSKWQRLQKITESAQKQCGRPWEVQLYTPVELKDLPFPHKNLLLGVLPNETTSKNFSLPGLVIVGPEGGLTESELEFLNQLNPYKHALGTTVLRSETAAIALVCKALGD